MNSSAVDTPDTEALKVGIVGVGQLAEHLVNGFCLSDRPPDIVLSPRSETRANALASRYSLSVAGSNQEVADQTEIVILAVPPAIAVSVAQSISFKPEHRVVCVAAGVPLAPVAEAATPARTVRAMPVTSATVRHSATVMYPPDSMASALMSRVGSVHEFERENEFETAMVAATYYGWVYALMFEVSKWLETHGLNEADARPLVAQMTRGACVMCLDGGKNMASEAREIGRPGTYTGLGLDLLERMDAFSAWSDTLDAVLEATRKGSAD